MKDNFTTEEVRKAIFSKYRIVKNILTPFNDGLVFRYNNRIVNPRWLQSSLKKEIRKLKLNDKLNFHSLRHTFATWLLQSGADIYSVSKLLGHSSVKVTEKYSHINYQDLSKTIQLLVR